MRTVISVVGKDTVGIIAKVSAVCADKNVNIIDITQSVLKDVFAMVMLTDISKMSVSMAEFSSELKKLGENLGLDIRAMHEDVFNSMHRI